MAEYRPRRSSKRWLEGAPRQVLACYDNGGKTLDRYTILFDTFWKGCDGYQIDAYGASENPYNPMGFGMSVTVPAYVDRKKLGKKLKWSELPEPVKRAVRAWCEEE